MTTTSTKGKVGKVEAREACVITVDARPVVWQRRIVRNRHTGRLEEIPVTELPPVDAGDEGRFYAFKRGEKVRADHEAVLAAPGAFDPVED
jgi:hypothetical protein